ncbi:hypothetical protein AK812_SmicGene12525 [Symbiodinium microadriaticum]|uniref:Uncharacterized protein n=1 Tax=Symbiodinium microadriaticum TaxID=2951 RepID=A0A1Q9EAE8_SYMMI|nr:hypothetical protein AK812_SmicGene12525 [Symbiodinium microadriaticum]
MAPDVGPGVRHASQTVAAFGRTRRWEKAVQCASSLRKQLSLPKVSIVVPFWGYLLWALQADGVFYNGVLTVCNKVADRSSCWTPNRGGSDGITPCCISLPGADAITLSALTSALGLGRRWQSAISSHYQGTGLQPDIVAVNALHSTLERSQQWQQSLRLLRDGTGHLHVAMVAQKVLTESNRLQVRDLLHGDLVDFAHYEQKLHAQAAAPNSAACHFHSQTPEWKCQDGIGINGQVHCDGSESSHFSLLCALAYTFEKFAHDMLLVEFPKTDFIRI